MNERYVLDSFAVLALLNNEPGAARVETLLLQAKTEEVEVAMSLINLGEVAYIVERRWGIEKLRTMLAYLEETPLRVAEANKERVLSAAHFKATYPFAYADAFAAALTAELNAILVTGDPEFRPLTDQLKIEWLPSKP